MITRDRDTVALPNRPMKCTAQRTGGRGPCEAYAAWGQRVCNAHGARAPQNKEAARRRLEELAPTAAEFLGRLIEDEDAPMNARVRAAAEILGRGGVPQRTEAALEVAPMEAIERPDLDAAIEATMRSRGMLPAADDEVVDGEIVEDDDA